jgi:ABC-type branched-subunit amino acid transport system substrate-binding protein
LSRGVVSQDEVSNIYSLTNKISDEFVSKFKKKYGEVPGTYADRAYDGVMLFAEIFNENKKLTSDEVSSKLKSGYVYQGYAGSYEFDNNGDLKTGDWIAEPVK